jgi:flavin-dependent dehydrogenase
MTDAEIIIVGAGPAGSTCAWKLRNNGIETLLLDKQVFPRPKPCAGWITPRVVRNLELDVAAYPHSFTRFDKFLIHYRGRTFPLPTRQYAIRRIEFDHWLMERAGVPVHTHEVETISKRGDFYILDDNYRCRYLIGAGGTSCPVYRTFFRGTNPREQRSQIATLEVEFLAEVKDRRCHLWFSDDNLAGYSWFVPKTDGYVNIGIGSKSHSAQDAGQSIQHHWKKLTDRLLSLSLLTSPPPLPRGCTYYLRDKGRTVNIDNAYIVGDAAGLATRDMGEGIGPAVESGIRAAEAIIHRKSYSIASIHKYSLWDLLLSR